MRSGLADGTATTVETVVTVNMVARLGGKQIHPVLATAQMIEWMEWAGRKLILPYLEESEDAVGYAIDIVHVAPTLVGESFSTTAVFRSRQGTRIITDVVARNCRGIIGHGVFTQVLVEKKTLADRILNIQHQSRTGLQHNLDDQTTKEAGSESK
ncbi:MAG: thioesterase [Sulfobacillus acidophilus]|uniref:Thioesterase n=1 Tax=Sulfobacillus acidophilus TaxID=53633 RepID=A0A2T2WFF0_9FIRM|nr:MAG: thioesterase [Sulfobacillus acidophilus]